MRATMPRPFRVLRVGDVVSIQHGRYAGLRGVVARLGADRVWVACPELGGQAVPITLDCLRPNVAVALKKSG
jgi:hypothetical protein